MALTDQPGPLLPARASLFRFGVPAALLTFTFIAFAPGLGGQFVNWDDQINFLQNYHYRGLSGSNLQWMFTDFAGHYMPLTWLTLGFDYVLWGMNPTGYHVTSLVFHGINTLLFYFLAQALLGFLPTPGGTDSRAGRTLSSAAATLFYSIHPLRTESVSWVTERRDVVSGFFFFLTLLAYLRMQREERGSRTWCRAYALSILAFALSLLSKAMGMTLPMVLLAIDVYPLGRLQKKDTGGSPVKSVWLEKIPFFVLMAAGVAMTAIGQKNVGATVADQKNSLLNSLLQPGYRLCFYLWKTFVPVNLSPLYLFRPVGEDDPLKYVLCTLAVAGMTVVLFLGRRRWPALVVTAWCFGALLAPVLGVIQAGPHFAADRYTYLASIPVSMLFAGLLHRWLAGRATRALQRPVWAISGGILIILGMLTFKQTRIWHDSIALWSQAIACDPDFYIAYNNRGSARAALGDHRGAILDYNEALRAKPNFDSALNNRGNSLAQLGQVQAAMADFDLILRLDPRYEKAYDNRASLKARLGLIDEAIADETKALSINPRFPEALNNRGFMKGSKGDLNGAIADCTEAIRLNPILAGAYSNRGLALASTGKLPAAIQDYTEALRLDPRLFEALANRGLARRELGDLRGAADDLQQALTLAPPRWAPRKDVEAQLADLMRRLHQR